MAHPGLGSKCSSSAVLQLSVSLTVSLAFPLPLPWLLAPGFWPAATVPTTNPRLSSLEDHYSLILCGAVCQVLVQNRPDFPNRVLLVASLKYPPLCVGLDNAPPTCALSPGFSTSQSGLTTGGSIRLSVPIRIWLSYRLHVLVHWAVERSVDKPPSAFPVHSLFICMLH